MGLSYTLRVSPNPTARSALRFSQADFLRGLKPLDPGEGRLWKSAMPN